MRDAGRARNGTLFVLGALALSVLFVDGAAVSAQQDLTVTNAVQVTANPNPSRAHAHPQIAVHPDTGELVIVEGQPRATRSCNVHISTNDGRTWTRGGDLMPDEYQDCTLSAEYGPYATLEFADDGTLYVAFVASTHPDAAMVVPVSHPLPQAHRHVFLARSDDGGRSFTTTMVHEAEAQDSNLRLNKGPMLAVDPSDSSQVYVGWRQGDIRTDEKLKTLVAASDDGGDTVREPVDISQEAGGDYPALAVTTDGTLHAVFWERDAGVEDESPRPIKYTRSTDNGSSFSTPEVIDPGNQSTSRPPLLVADDNTGNLYMTWYANTEVENEAEGYTPRTDILFRSSRDGGESWSDRQVINDEPGETNQFDPGIAVAPNGRIDIAWHDFRDSSEPPADATGQGDEDGEGHIYYASSTDEGQSFGPDTRISDRIIDRSVGVWGNNIDSNFNTGVASTEDSVYIAWQDTRNADAEAQAEDVYMSAVKLGDEPVAASSQGGGASWLWGVIGAGLALALAGIALLLAMRRVRARPAG